LVPFLIPVAILAFFLVRSNSVCESPPAHTDEIPTSFLPPYCKSADPAGPFLKDLHQNGLILDCRQLVPFRNSLFSKRKEIAGRYDEMRERFLNIRDQLRSKPRKTALSEAEELLPLALTQAAFPPWLGTTWNFYGASSIPGQGEIACGYFVAATLHAVGFNVKISLKDKNKRHYTLAGLPSEQIILKLVDEKSIRRFSNRPIAEVKETIKEMGPGIYLIGLDQHVAYLVWDGSGDVMAWHAKPGHEVVLEKPEEAPFISESKYRIIGKLDGRSVSIWLDQRQL
jgi:hypothetical protein